MAYVEGEMPLSTSPSYIPYGNGSGFFGSDGIWAVLLFAMIFGGWNGGFGGYGAGGYGAGNAILNATDNNQLHSEINSLQISNKLDTLSGNVAVGFGDLTNAITQSGYETRLGIADLGYKMEQGCCDLRYQLATEACATRQASADNTQRILDFLTQEKLASLTAENAQLKTQIDNGMQTNTIINALRPTPVPAYSAANIYGYYGNGLGFGGNNII